jgi:HAD superfamily hydrolase (TIGR01484 family)
MHMTLLNEKSLVIFDLDGTLAPSKQPMGTEMAELIGHLITKIKVAVISGGGYPQFETQLLRSFPNDSAGFTNLYLLPTSGTRLFAWKGLWVEQYSEHLFPKEKELIMTSLNAALNASGYVKPVKPYGPIIEDRGTQITFSGLGQEAPLQEKEVWDPTREKRERIVEELKPRLPSFDIRIGGMTSIDITRRGINKAYGIHKLEEFLKTPIERMVFVGDALFYGGNDYPAKSTGVDCVQVSGPEETKELVKGWLA